MLDFTFTFGDGKQIGPAVIQYKLTFSGKADGRYQKVEGVFDGAQHAVGQNALTTKEQPLRTFSVRFTGQADHRELTFISYIRSRPGGERSKDVVEKSGPAARILLAHLLCVVSESVPVVVGQRDVGCRRRRRGRNSTETFVPLSGARPTCQVKATWSPGFQSVTEPHIRSMPSSDTS